MVYTFFIEILLWLKYSQKFEVNFGIYIGGKSRIAVMSTIEKQITVASKFCWTKIQLKKTNGRVQTKRNFSLYEELHCRHFLATGEKNQSCGKIMSLMVLHISTWILFLISLIFHVRKKKGLAASIELIPRFFNY